MKPASPSRRRTVGALTFLSLSGLCAVTLTPAHAQATLTTIASFDGTDGTEPFAGVTFDSSGNLFGTTVQGSANGAGTVYEIAGAGLPAAVPEASTTVSLGLLLTLGLGGVVVARRKRTQSTAPAA